MLSLFQMGDSQHSWSTFQNVTYEKDLFLVANDAEDLGLHGQLTSGVVDLPSIQSADPRRRREVCEIISLAGK